MKILIIGCGSIGRRHAGNLRNLGVTDLLLFDATNERAETLAGEVKGRQMDALEQGFREKPDAALICTPTSLHLEFAFEALKHHCHLFVEKPISHSMEGVNALVEQAQARERILMVGYSFRFDPIVRQLRAALGDGRIGRVTSARFRSGSYLPRRHPWEDYRSGYGARRKLGGGVILDAIHELDLALWLLGQPETVYCAGGQFSDLEIDVEDTAEIMLSGRQSVVAIHLDYIQQPAARTCEIIGTRGQMRADLFARELDVFDGISCMWESNKGIGALEDMYVLEMRHFLDCIENQAAPEVNGAAALDSLLIAEAAKESMRSRLPVCFDEYAKHRTMLLSLARA
ncbi:MAG TPA: Gfo/Idh/MocA family oxidoreductase [Candidatus Acidoferrales bacterium]|nr:Gfo/Idh/MocA family oxidoreductase [Candidatus Acidoferrales bacterium]